MFPLAALVWLACSVAAGMSVSNETAVAQARRHLATAIYLEDKGQWSEAAREYERSLAFVPDEGVARRLEEARRRGTPGAAPANPDPAARAAALEKQAGELWSSLAAGLDWDATQAEATCRRIVQEFPGTSLAPEALWRLSALARMRKEGPDERGVAECMDTLIVRYPDSPLVPAALRRRLESRVALEQWELASAAYSEVLATSEHEPPGERASLCLGWARVLVDLGRREEALLRLEQASAFADASGDFRLPALVEELRSRLSPPSAPTNPVAVPRQAP